MKAHAEVERLQDTARRFLKLRDYFVVTSYSNSIRCRYCDVSWPEEQPEKHGTVDGQPCPAQLPEEK